MAVILNIAILDSAIFSFSFQTHSHLPRLVPSHLAHKNLHCIHVWLNLMPWQPSWIQTACFLLWDSLKNTLTPLWMGLKLIQSDSKSFILTDLHDGNHLANFHCHILPRLDSKHFAQKNWLKLIHSDSTWWLQLSLNLPSSIQPSVHIKNFTHSVLTQLDDWQPSWILPILDSDHFAQNNPSLVHSDSTWWWQPSWILPCCIQPF